MNKIKYDASGNRKSYYYYYYLYKDIIIYYIIIYLIILYALYDIKLKINRAINHNITYNLVRLHYNFKTTKGLRQMAKFTNAKRTILYYFYSNLASGWDVILKCKDIFITYYQIPKCNLSYAVFSAL